MTRVQALGGAALLGTVCGLRTFTGPAALALRGRVDGTPARALLSTAAAGELVGDKVPGVGARTRTPALLARVASGALSGRALAGAPGLAAGAIGAVAGTFGGYRARSALTHLTRLPDPVLGVVEDGLAAAGAALATRDGGEPQTRAGRLLYGTARGGVAGVAATAAMTAAQLALQRATGSSPSRTPEHASRKVLRGVAGTDVPSDRRDTLNEAAHWLYGTSWGVELGLTAAARERRPAILTGGAGLGLTAWAASLVELPALGVAPPVWRQPPGTVASDAALHLLYGLTAAAVLRALP